MAILKETEIIHEILGPIRYDDGKGDPKFRTKDVEPFWIARPVGWTSDGVEIYLSGDSLNPAPDSLARAIQAFKSLDIIEKEGKDLIHPIIISRSRKSGMSMTRNDISQIE